MTLDDKLAQLGSAWSFELTAGGAFSRERAEQRRPARARASDTNRRGNELPQRRGRPVRKCRPALLARGNAARDPRDHARGDLLGPDGPRRNRVPTGDRDRQHLGAGSVRCTRRRSESANAGDRLPSGPVACPRRLSRPALGTNRGDVRRGPVSRLEDGQRLRSRAAGQPISAPASSPRASTSSAMALPRVGFNWAPMHVGPRELHDVYLHPFEAAVREAGLRSMMNAYNELDGIPCAGSRELLTALLRGDWGFDGCVVSDYFAVRQLETYHRLVVDEAEAAATALIAGIDVELPSTDCYGSPLREAIDRGLLAEGDVDVSVRRVLATKFALGLFEQPYVDAEAAAGAADTEAHRRLARTIADKSLVLLKNDGRSPARGHPEDGGGDRAERRRSAQPDGRLQLPGACRVAHRDGPLGRQCVLDSTAGPGRVRRPAAGRADDSRGAARSARRPCLLRPRVRGQQRVARGFRARRSRWLQPPT